MKTYIRFSDFQSKSELLMTEKDLPFTDEMIVVLVHTCSQQLQLFGITLRNARIHTRFLKEFVYLRETVDLIGDNLTGKCLRRILVIDAPCRSTNDAESKFRGLILSVGNKIRKLLVKLGIHT